MVATHTLPAPSASTPLSCKKRHRTGPVLAMGRRRLRPEPCSCGPTTCAAASRRDFHQRLTVERQAEPT